jgi:hypothetical protein
MIRVYATTTTASNYSTAAAVAVVDVIIIVRKMRDRNIKMSRGKILPRATSSSSICATAVEEDIPRIDMVVVEMSGAVARGRRTGDFEG